VLSDAEFLISHLWETMRAHLTLFILVALSVGSFADQLREGAKMEVKSNSIWFQEVGKLTTWQRLDKAGNRQEFESYQAKELGARDAWQFTKPLPVKILSYDAKKNQVNVEMEVPGRNFGSTWWLDANSLVQ
jgi:hypothetical protein